MKIRFATCERSRALNFLKKLYPSKEVTEENAKAVLDFVEQDCFRIPDPDMHGSRVGIYPSKNWDESRRDDYIAALKKFDDGMK